MPEVLAQAGVQRAAEVVELAQAARLDVACAAVLLLKESGGGAHVWGHDGVPTAGAYVKGAPVTRESYLAYRAALARGTAGPQGCGPTQLTWRGFQDQADQVGGCWDWRANTLTGFRILAGLIRVYGEQGGFQHYNGAGQAAEAYGRDAVARLARLRAQLTTGPQEDDVTPQDIEAVAQRCSELVWSRLVRNDFGDTVAAVQIVAATDHRSADLQRQLADVEQKLDQLLARKP